MHWCELCPYANVRRDTTENHRWRHLFYGGPRGPMSCPYCDFSAQQSHLMRDHYKVHFRPCKYVRVESFTELVKLEVFMKEVNVQEEDAVSISSERVYSSEYKYCAASILWSWV